MLAYYISNVTARRLSLKNRGVKSARFHVLKGTRMPAVLVEVGFITNQRELAKLKDRNYRNDLSDAIARGILSYKKEFEKTDGFTN
jgi:N-acetylmuramoyl-L-alanine amidase